MTAAWVSRGSTGRTRRRRDALVSALVWDANAVVAALADAELDEGAAAALALLALVAGQGRGTGRGL
jgi:hypothetical protein